MESQLDAELQRRKFCIDRLRHGDMGEAATNKLMEKLSDDPDLLDKIVAASLPDDAKFAVTEENSRRSMIITTRIGSVELSDTMAARLRSLYVTNNPVLLLTPEYLADFSRSVFLLLYRYRYVDPGFKRQGYLAPQYFEAISEAFDAAIDLEAFAAAFNTTVPRYCSLFPDVESPFGSLGSFFELQRLGDNHLIQVSPPRVGAITMRAVEHCKLLLSQETHEAYHIVLLTPLAWDDVSQAIEDSGFSVWKNRVKRGDVIEYHDVVKNAPTQYPRPRVSVMSNARDLSPDISRRMHNAFSRA